MPRNGTKLEPLERPLEWCLSERFQHTLEQEKDNPDLLGCLLEDVEDFMAGNYRIIEEDMDPGLHKFLALIAVRTLWQEAALLPMNAEDQPDSEAQDRRLQERFGLPSEDAVAFANDVGLYARMARETQVVN